MGTPSSINRQVLRKLCAKFDTFVTSVTIRPIFCNKRPDYNSRSLRCFYRVRELTLQSRELTVYTLPICLQLCLFSLRVLELVILSHSLKQQSKTRLREETFTDFVLHLCDIFTNVNVIELARNIVDDGNFPTNLREAWPSNYQIRKRHNCLSNCSFSS